MKVVEKCINLIGKNISYLIPVMTLLMVVVIVSRYFFGIGRTDLQELVMYFHSLIFLGCAGYVFNQDEHVRVDIFYREANSKYKDMVNLVCGIIFLLPVCVIIFVYSIDLIHMSWSIKETSTEPGGLAYVYIQKSFIFLFPLTLIGAFLYKASRILWK
jgi:TRAP-type mannitol/chloroaromatic compound transport system permease small subunit|tara:strand:+ start:2054 stop:2527 length:474 start_codon:yes stop_codon:yes gene_type:complete